MSRTVEIETTRYGCVPVTITRCKIAGQSRENSNLLSVAASGAFAILLPVILVEKESAIAFARAILMELGE